MRNYFQSNAFSPFFFGAAAFVAEMYLSRRPVFEDQEFLCGCLVGAGIVLMVQGVYALGKSFAASRTNEADEEQADK